MSDNWPRSAFVQGLVGGVVTLVVLAVRAAIEGQTGVTFADLWTALAVGVFVTLVPLLLARLAAWRIRRTLGPNQTTQWASGAGFFHASGRVPDEHVASRPSGMDRFDKFTDRARNVLTLAQDEAQRFNHAYIGTEHLLLGLVREGEGVAARVLKQMGVELVQVRTAVEFIIGRGDRPVVGDVGLTPDGKRVIELAIDEARRLGHNYIGTEHLLLGLVREGEGIAAGVLESVGVSLDQARTEVLRVLEATGN
jgi:hypothetical protein